MNLSKQENYITKYYKLAQQIAFYKQKTSSRLIRSLGEGMEGMSFDGVTMAQSPGDGSSRGLCLLQIFYKFTTHNYTRSPFPREIIKARVLTSWGLCHLLWPSCAQGATWSRAMVVFLGDSGGTIFAQLRTPRTSLRRFPRFLLVRSLQHKSSMASCVPTFIAPWAHVMPSTWRQPIGPLEADVSQEGTWLQILTQAPEPRANPQGKDKLLSN